MQPHRIDLLTLSACSPPVANPPSCEPTRLHVRSHIFNQQRGSFLGNFLLCAWKSHLGCDRTVKSSFDFRSKTVMSLGTQQAYAYSSEPRAAGESKYRDEGSAHKPYKNIMFDRRVVRGSTYAAQVTLQSSQVSADDARARSAVQVWRDLDGMSCHRATFL